MIFAAPGFLNQAEGFGGEMSAQRPGSANSGLSASGGGNPAKADFLNLLVQTAKANTGQKGVRISREADPKMLFADAEAEDRLAGLLAALQESDAEQHGISGSVLRGIEQLLQMQAAALGTEGKTSAGSGEGNMHHEKTSAAVEELLCRLQSTYDSGSGKKAPDQTPGAAELKNAGLKESNSGENGRTLLNTREGRQALSILMQAVVRNPEGKSSGIGGQAPTGKAGEGHPVKRSAAVEELLSRLQTVNDSGFGKKTTVKTPETARPVFRDTESVLQDFEKGLHRPEKSGGKEKDAMLEKALEKEMKNIQAAGRRSADNAAASLQAENRPEKSSFSDKYRNSLLDTMDRSAEGKNITEKSADPAGPAKARTAPDFFESRLRTAESRIVSQVSVRLDSGIKQGSRNMTINMHPPDLGSIKVKINSDHGSLNVQLHAQNQQVAGILERNLPVLQQSLVQQGIDVSDLQVGFDSGQDGRDGGFEEGGWGAARKGSPENPSEEESLNDKAADRQPAPGAGVDGRGLSLRV